MKNETITTRTILGRYTVLRKRTNKRRPLEYSRGKCFHRLHFGLWSLYVSLSEPQKAVRVSITDK